LYVNDIVFYNYFWGFLLIWYMRIFLGARRRPAGRPPLPVTLRNSS
jgi:hypothetical protein